MSTTDHYGESALAANTADYARSMGRTMMGHIRTEAQAILEAAQRDWHRMMWDGTGDDIGRRHALREAIATAAGARDARDAETGARRLQQARDAKRRADTALQINTRH